MYSCNGGLYFFINGNGYFTFFFYSFLISFPLTLFCTFSISRLRSGFPSRFYDSLLLTIRVLFVRDLQVWLNHRLYYFLVAFLFSSSNIPLPFSQWGNTSKYFPFFCCFPSFHFYVSSYLLLMSPYTIFFSFFCVATKLRREAPP